VEVYAKHYVRQRQNNLSTFYNLNEREIIRPIVIKAFITHLHFDVTEKSWLVFIAGHLLRAKKVGHQVSVSFEKFDVVQALLSFF
jgi:hypothetical protein